MALSLRESNSIAAIADLLYVFLPGSGRKTWKGHVNFQTFAAKVGVPHHWPGGSKKPAIAYLLQQTLQNNRRLFEPLILEVVRSGIVYRQKQNAPITPEEIDRLNGHLAELGFKFPDLWDPGFRQSLCKDSTTRAKEHVERIVTEEKLKETAQNQRSLELGRLKEELVALQMQADRNSAGLALEKLLNRLFELYELAPRQPFRVTGEQIDGSFELDHETYLVEAKWEKGPLPEEPFLVLRGKIEGKSAYTRGVFIALNGASKQAKIAITRGKQPTFFMMDGYDLMMVLSEDINLIGFLRQRRRLLAEEGLVFVSHADLWKGSRGRQPNSVR